MHLLIKCIYFSLSTAIKPSCIECNVFIKCNVLIKCNEAILYWILIEEERRTGKHARGRKHRVKCVLGHGWAPQGPHASTSTCQEERRMRKHTRGHNPVRLWCPVNAGDSEIMLVKTAIRLKTLFHWRSRAPPLWNFKKEPVASCPQTMHGSQWDQHRSCGR